MATMENLVKEAQQLGMREDHAKVFLGKGGDPRKKENLSAFVEALAQAHDVGAPQNKRRLTSFPGSACKIFY